MKFKKIVSIIEKNGWFFVRQVGRHRQYHHSIEKKLLLLRVNQMMKFIRKL